MKLYKAHKKFLVQSRILLVEHPPPPTSDLNPPKRAKNREITTHPLFLTIKHKGREGVLIARPAKHGIIPSFSFKLNNFLN